MAAWEERVPVNVEAEEQHRVSLIEYKKKLIIDKETFPDPLTLKKTEWISENQKGMLHWPPVYYHDIAKYLKQVNTPQDLLHRLDCEYKEGKGFRYFACEFVKEIFWTGINDNSEYCFVKCKVTPSQRTSSTPYNVWAAIKKENPGGEVASAYCSCTAGLLGSCNHVAAILFRIEAAVSSGVTKPTCTSKSCSWTVPSTNKKFVIKPISDITFTKEHYRKRASKESREKLKKKFKAFSPSYESQVNELQNASNIRKKLYVAVKDFAPESRFVELIECRQKRCKVAPVIELPRSIIEMKDIFIWNNALSTKENIELFTKKLNLTEVEIKNIYNATKSQSDSSTWFTQRIGRLTASKFHRIYTRVNTIKKPNNDANLDNLFEAILGNNHFENLATKHGIAMEPHAKIAVISILKISHNKFKSYDPGMTVDKNYPYISVSPDLETFCECCGEGVVEIKSPYSICETTPSENNLSYLTKEGDIIKLKQTHQYFSQIQGQLAVTNRKIAWFFIFTHHGYHLEKIQFDPTYWKNILANLVYFWQNHLAFKILKAQNSLQITENPQQNECTTSKDISVITTPILGIQKVNQKVKKIKPRKKNHKINLYLCDLCKENCEDEVKTFACNSIACTNCSRWYHFGCVGIVEENQIPPTNKKWLCLLCKTNQSK